MFFFFVESAYLGIQDFDINELGPVLLYRGCPSLSVM